eukprot:TRINITY_DN9789_c0_g1_i1.p1 TRINITY_DN9789_c0_g1~~TRINITY_DN9789_c0_g1_i1.p1  ORF type:complete len:405 (+),score=85.81 TRINITY_DN9789_c0_g1_i1:75-1289(+)
MPPVSYDYSDDDFYIPAERTAHACWKKKRVLRELELRGWELLRSDAKPPYPPNLRFCFQQRTHGCSCGAPWRMLPRRCVDIIGAKTALARLLSESGLQHLAPTTFRSLSDFRQHLAQQPRGSPRTRQRAKDECGGRWFVKVSHLNARQGVRCLHSAEEAKGWAEDINRTQPRWWRYVIQAEVRRPTLVEGHKVMLRLWAVIVITAPWTATGRRQPLQQQQVDDAAVELHISRRLRVNKMLAPFAGHCSDGDVNSDVQNSDENAFADSTEWVHYCPLWEGAAATATSVTEALLARWKADAAVCPPPPPLGDGSSGWYNNLAFDFVPSDTDEAGNSSATPRPVLVEVNVDPSMCHRCSETLAFAEELVDSFIVPSCYDIDGPALFRDNDFRSVTIGSLGVEHGTMR